MPLTGANNDVVYRADYASPRIVEEGSLLERRPLKRIRPPLQISTLDSWRLGSVLVEALPEHIDRLVEAVQLD